MSYNGVGLVSVRGSGTSGYVQRNLSMPKPQRRAELMRESLVEPGTAYKKPNADIMEHAAKRRVEVKLMELRLVMEDQGLPRDGDSSKTCRSTRGACGRGCHSCWRKRGNCWHRFPWGFRVEAGGRCAYAWSIWHHR